MTFLIVLGVAVALFAVTANVASRSATNDRLFVLAKKLGGHVTGGNEVAGKCDGVQIAYRLVTRGSGSNTEQWTEVRAQLPDAYPLAIYMRRQGWLDRRRIERGEVVDVELGDAAFDARFLIEAAPAAVIAKLFDERARRFLMKQGDLTLETEDSHGKHLVLSLFGWIDEPARAELVVDEVARIARRVREAFEAVNTGTVEMMGSPFREMAVASEDPHAADRQRTEVHRLETKRAARLAQQRVTTVIFLAAVAFVIAMSIAAMH
ncbi:MAG TPA: hypothetical protein VFQ65_32385 [Kofleriaceae bacterium]|nr:hypothetical protein [Kofleriaceae bacterium]